MTRVKRAVSARKAKNKIFKLAKGYFGSRHKTYRQAKDSVQKAMIYAYRDRKVKKRVFRNLWITRINAAARQSDVTYSELIAGLKKQNIGIDRKMLANLAYHDITAFNSIIAQVKPSLIKI